MFTVYNSHSDSKGLADNRFSVKFQGKHFRGCLGLGYWIRWDQYIFDIRMLRAYLNMPKEPVEYFLNRHTKSVFEIRIKEIIDQIGCNSFYRTCTDMNKWLEKNLFEERKKLIASANGEEVDDLPF